MNDTRELLSQTVTEILTRSAPVGGTAEAESVAAAEQWRAFAESGLPWVGVSEEAGGSGGSVRDAACILRLAGRAGAAMPLAETGLLGSWLLSQAGLPLGEDALAVAPGFPTDDLRIERTGGEAMLVGHARRVPWASAAARFVALVPDGAGRSVVSVATARLEVRPGGALSGEPREDVVASNVSLGSGEVAAAAGIDGLALKARGAATRVLLIAGAIDGVVALTNTYATTRTQFGKPLAAFQAVAQHLAVLAEQSVLADTASELAISVLDGSAGWDEAAAAKIVAGEAATTVARLAHQVHGAIGVAQEYSLQRLTRRLWTWRDEYLGETAWASRLGHDLVGQGHANLWSWVSGPLAVEESES